jgi:putative ABC transport system permease protein
MKISFAFDPAGAGLAAFGALAVTIALGLAGTWRILGAKPAAALRDL